MALHAKEERDRGPVVIIDSGRQLPSPKEMLLECLLVEIDHLKERTLRWHMAQALKKARLDLRRATNSLNHDWRLMLKGARA